MPLTDKVKKKEPQKEPAISQEAWGKFLDTLSQRFMQQRSGIQLPQLSSPRDVSEQPYTAYGLDPTGQFGLKGPVAPKLQLPDTNFLPGSNGAPLLTTESSTGRSLQDTKLWNDILSGAYARSRGGDAGARSRGYMSQADEQEVLESTVPLWYRRTWNRNGHQALPQDVQGALTRSTSMSDITTAGDTKAARQVHAMAPDIETIRQYGMYDWTIPEGATDPAWLQYLSTAELQRRATEAQTTSEEYGKKAARYETAMGADVDINSDDPQQIQQQKMKSILAARDMLDPDKREKLNDLVRNSLVDQHGAELTDDELYIALEDDPIAIDMVFDGIAFEGLDSSEESRTASAFQGAYSQEAKTYRKQLEIRASNEESKRMEREAMADPQFDEIVESYQGSRTTDLFSRAIANGRKSLSIADRVLLDLTSSEEDKMNFAWAYQYMSEDQKRVFAYYSAQSKEKGREYLDSIRPMLNARTAEGHRIAQGNFATRGPAEAVLSWATARATNLLNVTDIPGQFWDAIFGDADPNSWHYANQAYTQNVTAAQAEWIAAHPDAINPLTGNNVWVDAYNWFGSAVDSGIAMGVGIAMGGGAPHFASLVTGFIQGGNAASSKLNEELTKGKGRAEAVIAAAACGAIEQASETWSVERILKEPAKFWLAAAKSWFAESSEEVVGYLGNTAADALISWTAQHENELQTRYNARLREYQRETDMFGNRKYTDEECIKLADADVRQEYMQELANDALGGGFGGLFMFGVSHAANNVRTTNEARALVNRQLNGQSGSRSVSTNQTTQTVTQGERQQTPTQQGERQQTPTQQTQDQQTPTQHPAQQDRPTTVLDATERQTAAEPQQAPAEQAPQDQAQPAQQPAQPQTQQPAQPQTTTQETTQRVGGVNDTDTRELTPRQSRRAADQALRHLDQNQGVRDSVQGLVDIGATMDGEAKRQADKLGKQLKRGKVDALQLGRTYATVSQQLDEESRKAVGRAMYDPMVLAFMGDGMRSADAKVAAQAIIDRMDGKKLNRKQRHLLGKINNIDAVLGAAASARANALSEEEKTERGQRIKKLQGLFTPEVDGKPSQTAERQAAAIDDAAQDALPDIDIQEGGRANTARYTADDGTESRVNILRIRRADGTTKVTIQHGDGRTEEISSEKLGGFGSETAAILVAAGEQNGLNDGELNLALQTLDPSAEGEEARLNVAAFFSVYNAGFDGFEMPTQAATRLGDRAQVVFDSAQHEAEELEKKRMENARKHKSKGTGTVDTSELDMSRLGPNERLDIEATRRFIEGMPVNVSFYESKPDAQGKYRRPNGWYDPSTDTLHIDIRAGARNATDMRRAVLYYVSHEMTEWMEVASTTEYAKLAKAVKKALNVTEGQFDRLVQEQIDKATGNKVRVTRQSAINDVIADASARMMYGSRVPAELMKMGRPGGSSMLRFMHQSGQQLIETAKKFIRQSLNNIGTAEEQQKLLPSASAALLQSTVLSQAAHQALWDYALEDAVTNPGVGEQVAEIVQQSDAPVSETTEEVLQNVPVEQGKPKWRQLLAHSLAVQVLMDDKSPIFGAVSVNEEGREGGYDHFVQRLMDDDESLATMAYIAGVRGIKPTGTLQTALDEAGMSVEQFIGNVFGVEPQNVFKVVTQPTQETTQPTQETAQPAQETRQESPSEPDSEEPQNRGKQSNPISYGRDGVQHSSDYYERLRDQLPPIKRSEAALEATELTEAREAPVEETRAEETPAEETRTETPQEARTEETRTLPPPVKRSQAAREATERAAEEHVRSTVDSNLSRIKGEFQSKFDSIKGRVPNVDDASFVEAHDFLQSRVLPMDVASAFKQLGTNAQRLVAGVMAASDPQGRKPGKLVNDIMRGKVSDRDMTELLMRAVTEYGLSGMNAQAMADYYRQNVTREQERPAQPAEEVRATAPENAEGIENLDEIQQAREQLRDDMLAARTEDTPEQTAVEQERASDNVLPVTQAETQDAVQQEASTEGDQVQDSVQQEAREDDALREDQEAREEEREEERAEEEERTEEEAVETTEEQLQTETGKTQGTDRTQEAAEVETPKTQPVRAASTAARSASEVIQSSMPEIRNEFAQRFQSLKYAVPNVEDSVVREAHDFMQSRVLNSNTFWNEFKGLSQHAQRMVAAMMATSDEATPKSKKPALVRQILKGAVDDTTMVRLMMGAMQGYRFAALNARAQSDEMRASRVAQSPMRTLQDVAERVGAEVVGDETTKLEEVGAEEVREQPQEESKKEEKKEDEKKGKKESEVKRPKGRTTIDVDGDTISFAIRADSAGVNRRVTIRDCTFEEGRDLTGPYVRISYGAFGHTGHMLIRPSSDSYAILKARTGTQSTEDMVREITQNVARTTNVMVDSMPRSAKDVAFVKSCMDSLCDNLNLLISIMENGGEVSAETMNAIFANVEKAIQFCVQAGDAAGYKDWIRRAMKRIIPIIRNSGIDELQMGDLDTRVNRAINAADPFNYATGWSRERAITYVLNAAVEGIEAEISAETRDAITAAKEKALQDGADDAISKSNVKWARQAMEYLRSLQSQLPSGVQYSLRDVSEIANVQAQEQSEVSLSTFMRQLLNSDTLTGTEKNLLRQYLDLEGQLLQARADLSSAMLSAVDQSLTQAERIAARNREEILNKRVRRLEGQMANMRNTEVFATMASRAAAQAYNTIQHVESREELDSEVRKMQRQMERMQDASGRLKGAQLDNRLRDAMRRLYGMVNDQTLRDAIKSLAEKSGKITDADVAQVRSIVESIINRKQAARAELAKHDEQAQRMLIDAMTQRALNEQAVKYEKTIALLKTKQALEVIDLKQHYEDRIRKIKDAAKAKQRAAVRKARSEAYQRGVDAEHARGQQEIQRLKDAQKTKDDLRDTREEIAKHEKAIRRAIAEIDSLIRGETDQRNVHESMKPLAEKLVRIFAVHDATTHSIVFNSQMAAEIVAEYQKLATLDGDVTNGMYDQSVIDALNNAVDLLKRADAATTRKGTREEQLNQARLRAAALEELSDAITQITHMIKNVGTIFRNGKAQSLDAAAESMAGPMRARGDYSGRFDGNATAFVGTNNLTMPYFVRRINNRGFTGLVNDIFHGGNTVYGRRLGEAQNFIQNTMNQFHYWTWANTPNDVLKLNVDGRQMEFTREQALFVLAAWNREHNTGSLIESHHLDRGGLVTEAERRRFGQRADSDISHFTGARVDQSTIDAIKGWLTSEQVAYMDAMVNWMSTTLADWGNETSMKLFGIKKYKEGMYFPFTVFKGNMAQSPISNTASTTNDTAISHPGFSHRRIGQASTPILLGGFSDVVAMHAAQMLSYSSLAVPMLNLNSVLNHRVAIDTDTQQAHEQRIQELEQQLTQKQMERDDARHNGEKDEWQQLRQEVANLRDQIAEEQERLRAESISVRSMFQQKYGRNMASYLSSWMRDMQGGVMQDTREQAYDRLVSLFKKGAVVGSMSVAMQQPLSYIRAATNIDARYLGQALVRNWRGSQEQMMKYAGTANIKAMGRFDVGVNAGSRAYLLDRDGQDYTFFKKLREAIGVDANGHRSFEAFKSRWDKIFGFLPQEMDTITWCRMWEAVKLEQAAKTPGVDTSSEAFLLKCGERFDELMMLTQVYDSTIVRSANMRSKSALMKMTTAFMAEPTISLNVMADAVDGLIHGRKGANLGCAVTTFALSAILQALIKGLWGGLRKDDKDKTMLEKWAASFGYNFIGEINPLTLIPGASDLIDMLNGKTIEREDMTLLSDLMKQGEKMVKTLNGESGGYTSVYQGFEYFGGSIAKLLGVPVKNVMRDMRAMWNFAMGNADRPTNWNVAGRALTENIMSELPFGDTSNKAYYNDIMSAMLRGDADEAASLRDYLTLGKGVKEDSVTSGVKSALKAAMAAGGVSLEDGWRVCEQFGIFTDKSKYYNWAQGALNPAESEGDKAGTKWTELDAALKAGQPVTAIRQELGQYGIDDAAITSHVKSSVDDWYMNGEITRQAAESILRQYSGQTDNEMYWTFKEWDARKAHAGDTGYKYTKYETLWDAIDNGKSVKAPVTELQTYFPGDPKNFKSTVSSAITSRYKPMYIELMSQGRRTEAANLLGYVLSAYEAIGYDRSAKLADIQKNWH